MIFQTKVYPENYKRIYYSIKDNGRCHFTKENSNEETSFYSLNCSYLNRYESVNIICFYYQKEYFLSMGRMNSYTEIFDFEQNCIIAQNETEQLLFFTNYNLRTNLIKLNDNSFKLSGIEEKSDQYYQKILKFDLNFELRDFRKFIFFQYYS